MGSSNNAFAIEAVRQLRTRGWLFDGSLRGANLYKADLTGADLSGANLRGANLYKAKLSGAILIKFNRDEFLSLATINLLQRNARKFLRLNIQYGKGINADLSGAYLERAEYNQNTQWPDDFNPKAAGAMLVDEVGNPVEQDE